MVGDDFSGLCRELRGLLLTLLDCFCWLIAHSKVSCVHLLTFSVL